MTCSVDLTRKNSLILARVLQGRSQDFSKGGSPCVTPRVLTASSCREYFDRKQISTVSCLTVIFRVKVLKILQICAFSPPKYCMLLIKKMKRPPKGGHGHPRTPPPFATPLVLLRFSMRKFLLSSVNLRGRSSVKMRPST